MVSAMASSMILRWLAFLIALLYTMEFSPQKILEFQRRICASVDCNCKHNLTMVIRSSAVLFSEKIGIIYRVV